MAAFTQQQDWGVTIETMWPKLKIFTFYRKGYSPCTSRGEAETRVARWGWWRGEQILPRPQEVFLHLLCGASRGEVNDPWLSEVEKKTSAKWNLCFAELGTGWNCSYFSVPGICVGEQKLKRESVDKMIRKLIGKRMLQRIAKRSLEKKQRHEQWQILRQECEIILSHVIFPGNA